MIIPDRPSFFNPSPVAISPDAFMLARCCHEMIYACRYRAVQPAVVRKVLDRFHDSGISVLRVVLHQLPESKARGFGYHGYGTQTAEFYQAGEEKGTA